MRTNILLLLLLAVLCVNCDISFNFTDGGTQTMQLTLAAPTVGTDIDVIVTAVVDVEISKYPQ